MARDDRPPDASSVFDHGQQLASPADGHEPGIVVVIGVEVLMGREADNDHGFGVEAIGINPSGAIFPRRQTILAGRAVQIYLLKSILKYSRGAKIGLFLTKIGVF